MTQIFGRDPAFWSGLVTAVLGVALSFGLFGLTEPVAAAITGVVSAALAFYVAWATKDTMLGVGVGVARTVLILVATLGFALTEAQNAAVISLVSLLFGMWNRDRTSPLAQGSWRDSEGA
jgi:hypothetical protein